MSYSLAFSQAIAIIVYVAAKVVSCKYDFVSTQELSTALNIARPTAVKILQRLSNAGIIETREGAKGGVRLAKAPAEVTLLDVLVAIEQQAPVFRVDLSIQISGAKTSRVKQNILQALGQAENNMRASLESVTIASLNGS